MRAGAVLFDLDGVLVDSRVPFARCVDAALTEQGFAQPPDNELHAFLGPPLHATFAALGAGERTQACVDAYRRRYRAHAAEETVPFDGIPDVLEELAARTPLAVATPRDAPPGDLTK